MPVLIVAIKAIYNFDGNAHTTVLYLSFHTPSQPETKCSMLLRPNRVCPNIYLYCLCPDQTKTINYAERLIVFVWHT
jgi:hypothetical protein